MKLVGPRGSKKQGLGVLFAGSIPDFWLLQLDRYKKNYQG